METYIKKISDQLKKCKGFINHIALTYNNLSEIPLVITTSKSWIKITKHIKVLEQELIESINQLKELLE